MKILRGQIPAHATQLATDYIRTVPPENWIWPSDDYAHPNWTAPIMQLLAYLPPFPGQLCEPQIVVYKPGEGETSGLLHVDELPLGQEGHYTVLVSAALTKQSPENGGVVYGLEREAPELAAGDVVLIDPDEPHGPTRNGSADARIAVYFRYIERS